MVAFDGLEVCELVGTFLLFQLSQHYNKFNFGLYQDDGLSVFKSTRGPQMERIKKHFVQIFRDKGLLIPIQCNMKRVNCLNVTLKLDDNSFQPYSKPEDVLSYVDAKSNHPPNILKQIPNSIELRLSATSISQSIFRNSTHMCEEALKKSGYSQNLTYISYLHPVINKNHKRNIIWFNPPFSKNVCTNIGKRFLNLFDHHFPFYHNLYKIFNRNSFKVSYICLPNMKDIISSHNDHILQKIANIRKKICTFIDKTKCPLTPAVPNKKYRIPSHCHFQ